MTPTSTDTPFDPNTTAYSLNDAYWLARAANIDYQPKDKIEPAVMALGLEKVRFLSKGDTEGFVAANDKIIVVAFRGTEPSHLQDRLSDERLHKVKGPLGEVHRGFLHAFELVKDDMLNAIADSISTAICQDLHTDPHTDPDFSHCLTQRHEQS
jgi:hypothetical protein